MNQRIEDNLSTELAHIFSVLPGVEWPDELIDYDDRIKKVKIDLRSGCGRDYLNLLTKIVKDKAYDYGLFHPYYVRGIWYLLKQALKHDMLTGPIDSIPVIGHRGEDENIFTHGANQEAIRRLSVWNKTNISYYNILKYGFDRIKTDFSAIYPKGSVKLLTNSYEPDFVREQYVYRRVKYMLFWPIMPTVLLWNGKRGSRNNKKENEKGG